MAITLSQQDYWQLVRHIQETDTAASQPKQEINRNADEHDITWKYPKQLGAGYYRKIRVRDGIVLAIADYRLHDDLIITTNEREHPLELTYVLTGAAPSESFPVKVGQHCFCGSGMAPEEAGYEVADLHKFTVNIHLEPALLGQWATDCSKELSQSLNHLIKPPDQLYHLQIYNTSPAMQQIVQQIVHCPFQGITQRMYLESKVWELMALQLAQLPEMDGSTPSAKGLKPDDIERIHYAKELLVARLDDPPSLIDLARLVGINDCKLKAGFRQVFGTTVFGYLQDCRMERARQLLTASEMTIAEAAQAVGYANRSHFALAFRKKFGINPSVYRKRQRHFWQIS